MRVWLCLMLGVVAACCPVAGAEDELPFRTDSSNQQLGWYRLKAGEFPPLKSEHRVWGELVEADFIHRCGQFRMEGTGELVNFTLLPYSVVYYLNAEGDLRDVPLGTRVQFFLYQDAGGIFNQAVVIQDDFTQLARQGFVCRVDKVEDAAEKAGMKSLRVVRQKPGDQKVEGEAESLPVNNETVIWKGDHRIKASEVAVGDVVLCNLSGDGGRGRRCVEIWDGAETQKLATEQQRKRHTAFLKRRGLAALIERVEGKTLVVTFFGDPAGLAALLKDEHVEPEQWAKQHRQVRVAVANQELRTYNPPVDCEGSQVLQIGRVPTVGYGSSGMQWTIQPNLLLEGFRKGHVIRIFAHQSWPVEDMPFGEALYTERPSAKMAEESLNQYSYRTDFGNEQLPWFQLKAGEFPPLQSQHVVGGELVKVDAVHRSGEFRSDRTGEVVRFTMPPFGTIRYLNAEAELEDLPLGTRFSFFLYADEKGAFSKAIVLEDDFTRLASETVTCRVEAVRLDEGRILVANQLAPMKDDKDHIVRPPDLGHAVFGIDETTRVWKGDKRVTLADIGVGDELLINLTGSTKTGRSRCCDVWVGIDTHKRATDNQRASHKTFLRANGLPAWIRSVDGKALTITFFSGNRNHFRDVLDGDPNGQKVSVKLVDEDLRPIGDRVESMRFSAHLPEVNTAGTYGSAGVWWVIEAGEIPDGLVAGRIVRVFKNEWLVKVVKH